MKDFGRNKLKNLEDELLAKLKSAMKEAGYISNFAFCFTMVIKWMRFDVL